MKRMWRRGTFFGLLAVVTLLWSVSSVGAQDASPSPWAGVWAFVSAGDDPGSGTATVDAAGTIAGTGTTEQAGSITVGGTVSDDGTFTFTGNSAGSASTGAQFSGKATGPDTAAGTWVNRYSKQKGTWTARRTSKTPSSTSVTSAPPTSDGPPTSDVPRPGNPIDGPVIGSQNWKTFRSPGSRLTCHIERPLYPWNWWNVEGGIRFSWSTSGLFILETANYNSPKARSYAHLLFSIPGVKGQGTTQLNVSANSKTNRFELDISSPIIQDEPQRVVRRPFNFVQVTLTDGTTPFTRAVGKIEFGSPEASGYCNFDLQAPKKKGKK